MPTYYQAKLAQKMFDLLISTKATQTRKKAILDLQKPFEFRHSPFRHGNFVALAAGFFGPGLSLEESVNRFQDVMRWVGNMDRYVDVAVPKLAF